MNIVVTVNYLNVVAGVPQQVQDMIEATLDDGSLFRDAMYYHTIAEHDAAVKSGNRDADAQARVAAYIAALVPAPTRDPRSAEQQKSDMIASARSTVAAMVQQLDDLDALPMADAAAVIGG